MPTHKVFVPVTLMSTDHNCAKLEGYSMLLHLDKGLYLLCGGMFFVFLMILIAFLFVVESAFMQSFSL